MKKITLKLNDNMSLVLKELARQKKTTVTDMVLRLLKTSVKKHKISFMPRVLYLKHYSDLQSTEKQLT